MPIVRIQCLLFVKRSIESEAESNTSTSETLAPKGYVLLPREFTNYGACNIFTRNNLQVITESQFTPPCNASFELIETLLDRVSLTSPPDPVRLYVDFRNIDAVMSLITVGSHDFDFITNFRLTEIRSAVAGDNLQVVENFLRAGVTVSYSHHRGGNLLHFAVEKGDEALVRLLLKLGVDINSEGYCRSTPLHVVAETAYANVADLLLKQGANIEARLNDGSSPLHLATERGLVSMVQLFVERGANFEVSRNDGFVPLHIATDRGQYSTVSFLLQRGANANSIVDSDSPLKGATPLTLAVKRKRCDVMRLLLGNGANVNARCSNNQSVLYFAVNGGHSETIACVLSHRPDVNDMANRKAFQLAFRKSGEQSVATVEKLLHYGFAVGPADVSEPDFLFGAIHKNLSEVVRELLSHGADVNKFHLFMGLKLSPLHLAAQYAKEDIIQLLLDHGAQVNAKRGLRNYEKRPIFDAVANSNADAVKLLLAKNAYFQDYPNLLHIAVRMRSPQIVEYLLESGVALNAKCFNNYWTPLSIAIFEGHANMVEVLMKFGAPFDLQMVVGDRSESLRTFLDYGFADLNPATDTFFKNRLNDYARWYDQAILNPYQPREHYVVTSNCAMLLLHHVVKIAVAFESIAARDVIPSVCHELFGLGDFCRQCEAEVADMKVERIGETSVTMYDILTRGAKGVASYASDERVAKTLESYDFNAKYPIYSSILACHFRQGSLRRELVTTGLKFFSLFFRQFSALPLELKEEVLSYLSNQDLIILRKSLDVK